MTRAFLSRKSAFERLRIRVGLLRPKGCRAVEACRVLMRSFRRDVLKLALLADTSNVRIIGTRTLAPARSTAVKRRVGKRRWCSRAAFGGTAPEEDESPGG